MRRAIYGTTKGGGNGGGVVFQLTPSGTGWTETVLYGFCSQLNCPDGASPTAGLIMDTAKNLYGTTVNGGLRFGAGVVFQLTPPKSGGTGWTETVLHSFCSTNGCDGVNPFAGVIMDAQGNLYGTTQSGGYGNGAVFQLTPSGTGWIATILNDFTNPYGVEPVAGLIMDAQGNLFGTTPSGGNGIGSYGVVFQLTNSGGTGWTETVLHSFCPNSGCTDGTYPAAGLIIDAQGNLYGTTQSGGTLDGGIVFEVTPSGTETILYRFCSQSNCADGANPVAGLIMDTHGNLYGTTKGGGNGGGVVFQLTPSGTGWTETVLYSFCSQLNCTDGLSPVAGLIMDARGNLYGTTQLGGNGNGVVFQLTSNSVTFAGTPGKTNCQGQSGSALTQQFGTIDAAAAALGYPSVKALQNAIKAFCRV